MCSHLTCHVIVVCRRGQCRPDCTRLQRSAQRTSLCCFYPGRRPALREHPPAAPGIGCINSNRKQFHAGLFPFSFFRVSPPNSVGWRPSLTFGASLFARCHNLIFFIYSWSYIKWLNWFDQVGYLIYSFWAFSSLSNSLNCIPIAIIFVEICPGEYWLFEFCVPASELQL